MAIPSRIVAVDIGAGTIKAAEFNAQKDGGLTLVRFGVSELKLDPNKEEIRGPIISHALKTLLQEKGIKSQNAILSVSAQSVFMRFVKLPPVDAMQVDQMVGFEAQQNVPFPIEEVVWDYQLMSSRSAGGEAEAIIVAMKADLLEAENQAAEEAGLKTQLIDVAPLALYNAFQFNYEASDECVLLIDIGARTTNLLFMEKGRLYTRGIPIAGNLISQNICNEFQEPFVASETLKKGKGFVHLGGAYADPDDRDAARISKLIRAAMTRLHNEVNRSMAFYRTQQGGSAPKKVYLTGGTSLLPYIDVFFAEKLNLPVEYFNPFRNITLGPEVNKADATAATCFLGEVVGLGLRETGRCPIEINLTPLTVKARQATAQRKPFLLGALAVWAAMFACLALYNFQQIRIVEQTGEKMGGEISELQTLEQRQAKLEKTHDQLTRQLESVKKLLAQRDDWILLLSEINSKIPDGVWITQFNPQFNGAPLDTPISGKTTGGQGKGSKAAAAAPKGPPVKEGSVAPQVNQLVIKGLFESTLRPEVINQFVAQLSQSPWFEIDPKKTSEAIISVDSQPGVGQPVAMNYNLSLKLKKPIDVTP
jgi:type IV pilus assembly protein PilM